MNNEQLREFASKIDFTELYNFARQHLEAECAFADREISYTNSGIFIRFKSSDIKEQCGAFGKTLESAHIESFSGVVFSHPETGANSYRVEVNIQYTHKHGGRNGVEAFTARYTDGIGWKFITA